jgi:hypothetical protein
MSVVAQRDPNRLAAGLKWQTCTSNAGQVLPTSTVLKKLRLIAWQTVRPRHTVTGYTAESCPLQLGVSSPAGRPLHAYKSVRELLEALRDAIAGHRSLLERGKFLHRDISGNNIIITDAVTE